MHLNQCKGAYDSHSKCTLPRWMRALTPELGIITMSTQGYMSSPYVYCPIGPGCIQTGILSSPKFNIPSSYLRFAWSVHSHTLIPYSFDSISAGSFFLT